MARSESYLRRTITRRKFLCDSATILSGVSALKYVPAIGQQKVSPNTDYSPVIENIKRMLPSAMAVKDIIGMSVALIDGENIVWSEGFGYTSRSKKVKVTADTLFHVGSISKSFTALGVLKAAGKGLLALDDPLKKHLSWFTVNSRFGAAESQRITLRHLLSHHSGLGTWSPLGNPSDPQYHMRKFEEVVQSTRDSWLKFSPGERFVRCKVLVSHDGVYKLEHLCEDPNSCGLRKWAFDGPPWTNRRCSRVNRRWSGFGFASCASQTVPTARSGAAVVDRCE